MDSNIKDKVSDRGSAMELFGKMLLNPIGLTFLLYAKLKGAQFTEKQIKCDFNMPKRELLRVLKWLETSNLIYKKRENFEISNLGLEILKKFEKINKRLYSKTRRRAQIDSAETTVATTALNSFAKDALVISTGMACFTVVGTFGKGIPAIREGYVSERSPHIIPWGEVYYYDKQGTLELIEERIGSPFLPFDGSILVSSPTLTLAPKNLGNNQDLIIMEKY